MAEITDINPVGRFPRSLEWVEFDSRTNVREGWLWDGETLSPPPRAPAPARRASAIDRVDATADRVRASDRSVGQYLDAEYRFVYDALAEYRASPDGKIPQAIRAHADAEGITEAAAAEQIAESAGRAEDRLLEVRRIRLAGKAEIREAGDDADFMEIARPYIDRLEALAPSANADG
ncbi:hypothetical protein M1D97_10295 [Kushneria sp. AK178]